MTVDLEFMPFRALATLGQALAAVSAAGRDNVAVMVDALHLARSGGVPADVAAADPRRLAVLQLCDAPLAAPARHLLADEAREGRLLPGRGGLPLEALLAAMPPDALLACEVPLGAAQAALSPQERARAVFTATMNVLGRPPAIELPTPGSRRKPVLCGVSRRRAPAHAEIRVTIGSLGGGVRCPRCPADTSL